MKANQFVSECQAGEHLCRLFLTENGSPVIRQKNRSGWSVPQNADLSYVGLDLTAEAFRLMRAWIEEASGKPLWEALRDGP